MKLIDEDMPYLMKWRVVLVFSIRVVLMGGACKLVVVKLFKFNPYTNVILFNPVTEALCKVLKTIVKPGNEGNETTMRPMPSGRT